MPLTVEQVEKIAIAAAASAATLAVEEAASVAAERAAKRAAERVAMSTSDMRAVVAEAVQQTLLQLGVDTSDPLSMQRDFQHLRKWREAETSLRSSGILVALGIFLSGLSALFVLGVKEWFKR